MRPVSICKAELGTSLAHLTEKKRRFASFREAESMLLPYLVLTHAASGCPHISFFLESAFPLLNYNPLEGGVEGSVLSMTESGYMDTSTFYMRFANHFIPNLPPARPVVLLVDGHDSHLNLELFQQAEKNGIYLYSLLQNATHLVQPADVGLFGPLKKSWYKEVRLFAQRNPNTDINKKNFCSVFKATWKEVMSPSVLVSAFRKSGIYPLDRKQISNKQLLFSEQ